MTETINETKAPVIDEQAAARAIATAALTETINERKTSTPEKKTASKSNNETNLTKSLYDTFMGLIPKFDMDEKYKYIINAYKRQIFEKLTTKDDGKNMAENIRLVLRQKTPEDSYVCYFLIHKNYLKDVNMITDFKMYKATFNSDNKMNGEIEEYKLPLP